MTRYTMTTTGMYVAYMLTSPILNSPARRSFIIWRLTQPVYYGSDCLWCWVFHIKKGCSSMFPYVMLSGTDVKELLLGRGWGEELVCVNGVPGNGMAGENVHSLKRIVPCWMWKQAVKAEMCVEDIGEWIYVLVGRKRTSVARESRIHELDAVLQAVPN